MKRLFGASLTIALAAVFGTSALAAELPEVKISAGNKVPQCATPGRLTAYLQSRNPSLDPRFEGVATQYMRHGEALGIRWDIAFFQMILETGALRFGGDVRPAQNNFAGLGASGGGAHGESFADVSTGVKAHLQHLLMYAGEHIDNPVADRTRKVQEWGVLTDWQKSIDGPMTYTLVAKQWAPTSRNYVRDVSTITDEFYNEFCNGDDPNPGLAAGSPQGRSRRRPRPRSKTKSEGRRPRSRPSPSPPIVDGASPRADTAPKGAEIAKRASRKSARKAPPLKALGAGMLGSITKTAAAEPDRPSRRCSARDAAQRQARSRASDGRGDAETKAPREPKRRPPKPDAKGQSRSRRPRRSPRPKPKADARPRPRRRGADRLHRQRRDAVEGSAGQRLRQVQGVDRQLWRPARRHHQGEAAAAR